MHVFRKEHTGKCGSPYCHIHPIYQYDIVPAKYRSDLTI